jgi:hypothetical protein
VDLVTMAIVHLAIPVTQIIYVVRLVTAIFILLVIFPQILVNGWGEG